MKTKKQAFVVNLPGIDLLFFRIGGVGLSNILIFCYFAYIKKCQASTDAIFIFPTIAQAKIGPWFRREKDKRNYFGLFPNDLLKRIKAFLDPRIKINKISFVDEPIYIDDTTHSLSFKNLLIEKYNKKNIEKTSIQQLDKIAVHIRLGDFQKKPKSISKATRMNYRQDLAWFINVMKTISHKRNEFIIFSDEPHTLQNDSSFEGFEFDQSKDAFAALIKMSNCKSIVASNSSFSLLACVLSENKSIIVNTDYDIGHYINKSLIKVTRI